MHRETGRTVHLLYELCSYSIDLFVWLLQLRMLFTSNFICRCMALYPEASVIVYTVYMCMYICACVRACVRVHFSVYCIFLVY